MSHPGGVPYPDKLLGDDEEVVRHLHPHWLTLFWPVVLLLVIVGAASFGAGLVPAGDQQALWRLVVVGVAAVLLAFLRAVDRRYRRWVQVLGDPVSSGLAQDYLAWSSTVGSAVTVKLPDGSTLDGVAEAVDWDGRLVVRTAGGVLELASGDVRHVRPRRWVP